MTAPATADRDVRPSRLPELLAATAVGVYVLLAAGAATALLDGAACTTWPACGDGWLVGPGDPPARLVAWAHRALTLVVGGLLVAGIWRAYRLDAGRRVRGSLLAVAALYPVQIGLGAIAATAGATTALAAAHLVVAMAIFAGVLLALLWRLEAETPTGDGRSAGATTPTADAADADPPPTGPASGGLLPTARAYVELTKPKLWWLLTLVALAAMALAGGPGLDLRIVVATVVGGVLAIGASGTFNNVLERDRDRRMARTADRPVASETVPARRATAFGLGLAGGAVATFLAFVNVLAAALGLLAILFYSVGYTLLLKPNTTQNIVIGGAVGAFPALIGWAAVTDMVGVPAAVLGAVVFLWTPAHFYNLALVYRDDYARAGFPMLPVVRGTAVTRRHVLLYLGATLLGAVALGAVGDLGPVYAAVVTLVGGAFLWAVLRLFRERDEAAAWRAFHASNAFLGALLVAVLVDALVVL